MRVWYDEANQSAELKVILWKYRDPRKMGDFYHEWQRWAYSWGLIFLLASLALTLPPEKGSNMQTDFRWSAFGLALIVCSWQLVRVVKQWICGSAVRMTAGTVQSGSGRLGKSGHLVLLAANWLETGGDCWLLL